jgi:hypothetical protein
MRLHRLKSMPVGVDDRERAYTVFRAALLNGSGEDRPLTVRHAEGLARWLRDETNVRWARTVVMGECGQHSRPHSLEECLRDEFAYWRARAQGATELQARRALRSAA